MQQSLLVLVFLLYIAEWVSAGFPYILDRFSADPQFCENGKYTVIIPLFHLLWASIIRTW